MNNCISRNFIIAWSCLTIAVICIAAEASTWIVVWWLVMAVISFIRDYYGSKERN